MLNWNPGGIGGAKHLPLGGGGGEYGYFLELHNIRLICRPFHLSKRDSIIMDKYRLLIVVTVM